MTLCQTLACQSDSESITSGGYTPDPESITSGPIVSYKHLDGSVHGENPDGLPTGNGELEFYIDTNVIQRVDDIKSIVSVILMGHDRNLFSWNLMSFFVRRIVASVN